MEFKTIINKDGEITSRISCQDKPLSEISDGLELTIREWTRQLEKQKKSQIYQPELNFLYANTPNGEIVALVNGVLNVNMSQTSSYSNLGGGLVTAPPSRPSVVQGTYTTIFDYELVFENLIPREWCESAFYLRIGNIKFILESWSQDSTGKSTSKWTNLEQQYFYN